jgi:hypothetical protein
VGQEFGVVFIGFLRDQFGSAVEELVTADSRSVGIGNLGECICPFKVKAGGTYNHQCKAQNVLYKVSKNSS